MPASRRDRPALIGISCCVRDEDVEGTVIQEHKVGDKYIMAIAEAAGAIPVLIPSLGPSGGGAELLERLDGLFLTGSPSNVEPHRYDLKTDRDCGPHDTGRDQTTLDLIRRAIDSGLPMLAVCRGHQEVNVALGGTLHPHLHDVPGHFDHRSRKDIAFDRRYDIAHAVEISPGGPLATLNGGPGRVLVNSLHAQGIDRLAPGLRVEATSDDGVIEAVSVEGAKGFALSVQWHPEHRVALEWPLSRAIFRAFGDAARACANGTGVTQAA